MTVKHQSHHHHHGLPSLPETTGALHNSILPSTLVFQSQMLRIKLTNFYTVEKNLFFTVCTLYRWNVLLHFAQVHLAKRVVQATWRRHVVGRYTASNRTQRLHVRCCSRQAQKFAQQTWFKTFFAQVRPIFKQGEQNKTKTKQKKIIGFPFLAEHKPKSPVNNSESKIFELLSSASSLFCARIAVWQLWTGSTFPVWWISHPWSSSKNKRRGMCALLLPSGVECFCQKVWDSDQGLCFESLSFSLSFRGQKKLFLFCKISQVLSPSWKQKTNISG